MVLLYGYYGEQNAGDDAFTAVCAIELHRRGYSPVGVLSHTLPRIPALPARPLLWRRRWRGVAGVMEQRRIAAWLRRGAHIVVGGGSHFRSHRGITEIASLLDRAPHQGHRALGVSIGPFTDDRAAELCARTLLQFESVTVRDHVSLLRARELAPDANITLTFDLAPLLSQHIPPTPLTDNAEPIELGLALCGPALDPHSEASLEMALTEWLERSRNHRLVLFPFNAHPRKGDVAVHHRIAEALTPHGQVEWCHYAGDPIHTWKRISRLNGMVAMRLHAAVFSYCTERPTWILPYEEKCTAWASMIGHDPAWISTPTNVTSDGLSTLTSVGGPTATLPVAEAVSMAATNFDWSSP